MTLEVTVKRMLGSALVAVDEPVDGDGKRRGQLLDRLNRDVGTLSAFDESGMASSKPRPLIKSSSRDTKTLSRRTKLGGDLHEDNCTRKYNCRQPPTVVTDVLAESEHVGMSAAADPTNPINERIRRLMQEKGLSGRQLAKLSGVGLTTINKTLQRGSNFRSDNLAKVANALEVPVQELAGAPKVNTEIAFDTFVKWVHNTPALAMALTLDDKITVGDLLRYKAAPSSRGEHAGEARSVLEQIKRLRYGIDDDQGTDVTDEEATKVLSMSRRKPQR